jgi:RES domain-containing protein
MKNEERLRRYLEIFRQLAQPKCQTMHLVRCVARDALEKQQPPDFLFVSGQVNRYNPRGVQCLYFGETFQVAHLEYVGLLGSPTRLEPPFTTFTGVGRFTFLDLGQASVRESLGLTRGDLHREWRTAARPIKTQILGLALSKQNRFCAIRYPSVAAAKANQTGFNFAVFEEPMRSAGFSLRVDTGPFLESQSWPL